MASMREDQARLMTAQVLYCTVAPHAESRKCIQHRTVRMLVAHLALRCPSPPVSCLHVFTIRTGYHPPRLHATMSAAPSCTCRPQKPRRNTLHMITHMCGGYC